jgi:hypothetical protein
MYQKTLYRATSRTPPTPLLRFRAFGRLGGARASARSADSSICDRASGPPARRHTLTRTRTGATCATISRRRLLEPVCLPACLIPPTPQALGPWVLIYRKLEGARIRRTPLDRVQKCQKKFLERKESEEKKNCVCMCTCECACVFVCVDGGKDVCVRVRV